MAHIKAAGRRACGSAGGGAEPAGACAASSGSSRRAGGTGAGGGRLALPFAGAAAKGLTMLKPQIAAGAALPAALPTASPSPPRLTRLPPACPGNGGVACRLAAAARLVGVAGRGGGAMLAGEQRSQGVLQRLAGDDQPAHGKGAEYSLTGAPLSLPFAHWRHGQEHPQLPAGQHSSLLTQTPGSLRKPV